MWISLIYKAIKLQESDGYNNKEKKKIMSYMHTYTVRGSNNSRSKDSLTGDCARCHEYIFLFFFPRTRQEKL